MTEIDEYLLDVYGPDPFSGVREASESHRISHAAALAGGEQECGVYPSDSLKMRVLVTLVKAIGARRVLEIGGGLGYSALWLSDAMGAAGRVETIDRFSEHIAEIRRHAAEFGMADRIAAVHGEGADILPSLEGPYDAIHDDGWFAAKPAYYDLLPRLLRPGGLLIMSNWFLLEHAVTGQSPLDWSTFAGPTWAQDVRSYAEFLVSDRRFDVSFIQRPAVALAVRLADG